MTHVLRILLACILLASAGLAAAAPPKGPAPVEGTDYVRIEGGAPFAPVAGTVEVVEVFSYTCGHCASLEPALEAWARTLPKHARLLPLHASFGGASDTFARAYFAARMLKAPPGAHAAMFKALHEQDSVPLRNPTESEIAQFYTRYNIAAAKFVAAMQSPAVAEQVRRAQAFIERSEVGSTPMLVVNGRYRITAATRPDTFRVADHLIARESRSR